MNALGLYNYWIAVIIMMIGFYGVIAKHNLVKQAISLGLFQTGVFLFYITMARYRSPEGVGGRAPVWEAIMDGSVKDPGPYDNPLPHVLMLTAIVVGVSTLSVALAIIMNIKRLYGTIEEDEILAMDDPRGRGITVPDGRALVSRGPTHADDDADVNTPGGGA